MPSPRDLHQPKVQQYLVSTDTWITCSGPTVPSGNLKKAETTPTAESRAVKALEQPRPLGFGERR